MCLSTNADVISFNLKYVGPDTGDLVMRFGIHSGQVTAGVLRGEKSRFQLFGDTVNTGTFRRPFFAHNSNYVLNGCRDSASFSVENGKYRYGWSYPMFRNYEGSAYEGW